MWLFWERGYEAASISELTESMGITPPSLYAAFGDKKQLFFEAVDRYQAGPARYVAAALREPTAERAIRRLFNDTINSFCSSERPKGCMVVLSATNCTVQCGDIVGALAERRRLAQRAIRDRILVGRKAGELPADADVDALTGIVVTTLYGFSIMARDGASRASLIRIANQAMRLWPKRRGRADRGARSADTLINARRAHARRLAHRRVLRAIS